VQGHDFQSTEFPEKPAYFLVLIRTDAVALVELMQLTKTGYSQFAKDRVTVPRLPQ